MVDAPDRADAKRYVLGVGCENGAPAADLLGLAGRALEAVGIDGSALICIASIDAKKDEPAVLALVSQFSAQLVTFDAVTLEKETPRLKTPSARVFALIGCHGVAEAAAFAAAGPDARLVLAKIKSAFTTAAIAEI